MKNRLLKDSFSTIALFCSSYMSADDYSGRHVTDDGGGGFSIPTPIALALILILSLILILFNRGKLKDKKDGSMGGCLGYIGLIAFVFFCCKACS